MIIPSKINTLSKELDIKLSEINTVLRNQYQLEEHVGVLEGLSGIALFQFYYAKYTNTDQYSDWGQETLEKIISKINQGYNYPTYSSGIAGSGWVFDHLNKQDFVEIDCDDLLNSIDDYLYITMLKDLEQGYYDFLHGATGYAYYFLNRYQSTNNTKFKRQYRNYLIDFVERLTKIAIKDKNGLKWLSSINSVHNTKVLGYNLSLSHGISSIVSFLSKLVINKEFQKKYSNLLKESVRYLENAILQEINSTSIYPCWVLKNGEKDKNSRLAWCYGDFGIGLALLKASKVLKDEKLNKKALSILEKTSQRKEQSNTKVIDAGICHGAFGNAQIYNYLYKETLMSIYRDAATYWMKNGLEMSTYKDGYAGFKQWFGKPDKWKPKTSLLEGVAGIGLTIIDYLSKEQHNWDECLLIS